MPIANSPGSHVLQVNGYTPDRLVRSVSVGLTVTGNRSAVSKRIRIVVYFDALSSKLDAKDKRQLAALVGRVPSQATNVTVQVIGYVRLTPAITSDTSMSAARARRTAAALRVDGLMGLYYVSGEGRTTITGPKGRRVEVIVAYLVTR